MDFRRLLSQTFGLNDREACTYLALLQTGPSTVKPIADLAGIKRTSIYNFIDRLVELNLVHKTVIRGRRHYQAVSPDRLLELAQSQLHSLNRALPGLKSLESQSGKSIRVHYFEGTDEVKNIVKEETKCTTEALYVWPGRETLEMIGGAEYMAGIDSQRIAKGVQIRVVRFRQKDKPFGTSAHGQKYKRKIRWAPPFFNVSICMGIYDTGKVAFFSSKKEGFGVLIESNELVELMQSFFELLWKSSSPASEGQG